MDRIISFFIIFSLVVLLAAGDIGRKNGINELQDRVKRNGELKIMLIQAILEKQRSVLQILSGDRDVFDLLTQINTEQTQLVNLKLNNIALATKASVIYVLNNDGLVIGASNYQQADSFIGNNFSYRPYFIEAKKQNYAEYFAQGAVSHKPGFYIAHKVVNEAQKMLGVIVIKLEFSELEQNWRNHNLISFISDLERNILITNLPDLRFKQFQTLPNEALSSNKNSQIITFVKQKNDLVKFGEREFIAASYPLANTNWQLNLLLEAKEVLNFATYLSLSLAILGLMLLSLILWFWWWRYTKNMRQKLQQIKAKQELEQQVSVRTSALRHTNLVLQYQISERIKAQNQLSSISQELAKANRLAILGQSIAGVAHEVKQPLTAIRSYAENAQIILQRECAGITPENNAAYANLQRIVALTERIAHITDDLRNFARKAQHNTERVILSEAISGALMLLSSRIDQSNCQIVPLLPPPNWCIMANQIRIEQVLINLIQNAIEASLNQDKPQVKIYVKDEKEQYAICVQDNGQGIDAAIKPHLFTPFSTNKPNGLGLGLVISQEIVHSYGGNISFISDASGACFTIKFKKV